MMNTSKMLDTVLIFEAVIPALLMQTLKVTWTQNALLCIQS